MKFRGEDIQKLNSNIAGAACALGFSVLGRRCRISIVRGGAIKFLIFFVSLLERDYDKYSIIS